LLPLNAPGHGDRSVLLNGAYIDTITTPLGNYGIINMPPPPEEVDDGIAAYRWAFSAIKFATMQPQFDAREFTFGSGEIPWSAIVAGSHWGMLLARFLEI
jgi:hypothetical protein